MLSVKIDPQVVDPGDTEMLEDLIVAAYREAFEKVSKTSEDELSKFTGGMKLPGLF